MIIAANLSRKWLEFNKPEEGYFAVNFSGITKVNFMFTPSSYKLEVCVYFFSFSEIGFYIYIHTYHMMCWGQIKISSCYEKHNGSSGNK